jgi:lipoprotein-anchoring transpeptidase ErfK/SrfK
MPYMQRLTWYGIALHAGRVPGYPASHGCIRLPKSYARKLYALTDYGTTVTITREKPTTAEDALDLA